MDSHKEEAGILINSFAAAHAVIAYLLANTVIGDTVILTGLTYAMIEILGGIYEVKVSPAKIASRIFGLVAGTYLAGKLLFWVPGLGNWANAASTIFVTETIGWTCVALFSTGKNPETISKEELSRVVDNAKKEAEKYKKETKEVAEKMTSGEMEEVKNLSKQLRDKNISKVDRQAITQQLKGIYETAKKR